ncbi:MAG TPA: peptide chain release factor N(5)-glutamine methyltransferase [Rubrivivax sp.]|nr:peptide chain release factor N(5)-glutamine methyltransferase [Rubrivivax sp.]
MSTAPPATVDAALTAARDLGVDRLDAQWLLAHHLGTSRSWLLAHRTDPLPADIGALFLADLRRRADGVPLAYLTGEREFHGLPLRITPEVLDPRPDTETLVDWALELLGTELAAVDAPEVVDLGTGSGAIALAVKHACTRTRVRALDASPAALAVARANGVRLGLAVDWLASDWWSALPPPQAHLALSNPPYIAAADPHLPSLRHEPRAALTPGADGLAALRAVIAGAAAHLQPAGWLLLEHGHDQADAVRRLLADAGFERIATRRDLGGNERCSGGRRIPETGELLATYRKHGTDEQA